jgi:alternative ribosome-rescue factor|tara:strand:- start:1021 stop:1128 length:108 start_codon:yes stop_codon:yes gene_type:complete
MGKKNLVAKNLMTKRYKPRVVKPKKGKGSFKRKKK